MQHTLSSNANNFNYVTTEVYTQVEMCYNLISATTPVLRIFLQAAKSGVHGTVRDESLIEARGEGSRFTIGSSPYRTKIRSVYRSASRLQQGGRDSTIELTSIDRGETITNASAGSDEISVAIESSERAIVVRQTVDVQYTYSAALQNVVPDVRS